MRSIWTHILLYIVAFCIVSGCAKMPHPTPRQHEPAPAQTTFQQIEEAKRAFAKYGAEYVENTDRVTMELLPVFRFPIITQDRDLVGIPSLPFAFELNLTRTRVTDAGLKELKDLKNLTTLSLSETQITDLALRAYPNNPEAR
jgi:hypothetical protein